MGVFFPHTQSWASLYCPHHLQTALSSVLQTWWCFFRTHDSPHLLLRYFSTVIYVGEEVHQAKAWRYVLSFPWERRNGPSLRAVLSGAFKSSPSKTFVCLLLTLFWNGRWNPTESCTGDLKRTAYLSVCCSWGRSYRRINTLMIIKMLFPRE